jgi:formate dehydrogenase subunit gamma
MTTSVDAVAAPVAAPPASRLPRFDAVERAVHWTNAALFLFLIVTGFTLYGAPGTGWIGHKHALVVLHTWVGYALPIPVVLGIATRLGRQLRDDFRRFARWTIDDYRWWRRRTRRAARLGKFNPGQKLNAVFIGACIVVMPVTGTPLRWPSYFSHTIVSGADFTHRWFAFAILLVTVGHIVMAAARPSSLRGMVTGKVAPEWARHEHPRWYQEVRETGSPGADRSS